MPGFFDRFRSPAAPDWDAVVERHYDPVWRFCLRQVGPDRAADAAQETFLTAMGRWSSYRGSGELRTWLLGIALNHCRNLRRKQPGGLPFEFLLNHAADERGKGADQVLDRAALAAGLARLSAEHQEVVLLHEVEGLTYAEIAELTHVPEGTVKSRLYHALRRLRETMSDAQEVRS